MEILKKTMRKMIEKGNTIVVIDHNVDFIVDSDYIIDLGPDAGKNGGKIVFEGFLDELINIDTHTGWAVKEYYINRIE